MIIRKYVVKNMNEALSRIRYDLGQDAVIISQRKIKQPGLKGIFSPKAIEVTAAIDNKSETKDEFKNSINAIKKAMETQKKFNNEKSLVHKETKNTQKDIDKTYIMQEMQEMKNMINEIKTKELREDKSYIQEKLEEKDINKDIVKNIVKNVDILEDDDDLNKVKQYIKNSIGVSNVRLQDNIVLVGPTGVGKTTTIAKLAGKLSLIEKKKVGLITIDTYRIGAVEQLSTYADIMNIPFKVILSPKEMEDALEEMKNCDVILIDTTGRSSKNKMQIAELNSFIQKVGTNNIHLVVSCTTKNKDVKAIIDGYNITNFNNIIITKLDETSTYGSILNILNYANKPLSFVTTGQNVPNDIKTMTNEEITNLILGEEFVC